ncbi:MAG TPA: ferritin-like domain-containing protein [Streptosporangiaceae bacterium]
MSSYDHYATPVKTGTWDVPAAGATRFTWEYEDGRGRLLDLYQRGKDKQWDATKRIDWDLPVNPTNIMETPDEFCPIYGSRQWDVLNQRERDELGLHLGSWLFSQFLHGEQGALTVAARIVESVPDMDSKFYAATQTMDEARHVELYSRFIAEKIGLYYPINQDLGKLLADALNDSRWDLPYLGMQVLIEGLALAAFGVHRDLAQNPLVKQLLAYVMQDEARHVAFGRLALRDYYAELTDTERADREEFVVEGCYLMRDRFRGREVWERMGFDVAECLEFTENSPIQQQFRALLFSRIVPCVKDIGLWGRKVQQAYADLGVLDAAKTDLEALMRDDEEIAERVDQEKYEAELAARKSEVDAAIAGGSDGGQLPGPRRRARTARGRLRSWWAGTATCWLPRQRPPGDAPRPAPPAPSAPAGSPVPTRSGRG